MKCITTLCFVSAPNELIKTVTLLLEHGIRWIQYREKRKSRREIYLEALRLREITRQFEACLIINDYPDIALAVAADGVHLGQDDLPLTEARHIIGSKIVGISTHTADQAFEAEKGGADYIGFGPVFFTMTKDAGTPKGIDSLKRVKEAVKIPVIAIGGITADNIGSVLKSGCDGVAVSSGLLTEDIVDNVRKFMEAFDFQRNKKV
jgi:thiamine-phosphate pyrophosphorylase